MTISHTLRDCRLLLLPLTLVVLSLAAAGCGGDSSTPTSPTPSAPYSQTDLRVGTGTEASAGRRVFVNYTGWFYNPAGVDGKGQAFDSNTGRGLYPFVLGTRNVIAGWDRGVAGMRVGGLRRLVIPPELAYGSTGTNGIPPNSTLIFDIELVDVQ